MAFLDEISGDKYTPDENEKQKRLADLSKLISQKYSIEQPIKKRRIRWRNLLVAAVCVLFLMATSVFICAAAWNISPRDVLIRWGKDIFHLPYNEEIEESGFTFIFYDNVTTYSTLDQFAQSEQLDILLPQWLPESIKIESIIYTKSNENEQITIEFNNDIISYRVKLNQNIEYSEWDIITQESINNIIK